MTDTRYARNGRFHLAYQILGDGPLDLLCLPGTLIPLDAYDEHPLIARFIRRLSGFARLIALDRRGVGQSDSVGPEGFPQPQDTVSDLIAVLDAAGAARPAVLGGYESSAAAIALGALHPDRISSLVLVNGFSKFMRSPDHDWGFDPGVAERYEGIVEGTVTPADQDLLAMMAPSVASDDRFRSWWDRAGRRAASPSTALAFGELLFSLDVRDLLPRVAAPTLVIHKTESEMVRIEEGRYLAAQIPGAILKEIDGADCLAWVDADEILDATQEFLTGTKSASVDRVLATVLFTDIVDSTKLATELGDQRWRELLDTHDSTVQQLLNRDGGRLVKQTGDGSLATFAGPGPAIRCAIALRDALASEGITIRAGIHTGEVEVRGGDVGGIAVHIAARVMGEAGSGEIIVSSVVPPLVVGSDIEFTDRGARDLRGVPGDWRVLSVDG